MFSVCVVGAGVVGLPLAELFRSNGHKVMVYDNDVQKVMSLRKSESTLTFEYSPSRIHGNDFFVVAVPTMALGGVPSLDSVRNAVDAIGRSVGPSARGKTIVIESTVGIGDTRAVCRALFAAGFHVGFSPERVDLGRVSHELADIPKIVSGADAPSLRAVTRLYESAFGELVPVESLEVAEGAKLLENAYRALNIAFANEFRDACDKHGLDAHKVIDAASTKPYGFEAFRPWVGVGGACIAHDPWFLIKSTGGVRQWPLLRAAIERNDRRPVELARLLGIQPRDRILVVGVGYKANTSEWRNSPVTTFIDAFPRETDVYYYDPFITDYPHATCVDDLSSASYDAVLVMHPYMLSTLAPMDNVVYFCNH
jgi:nucleotide sugar dehydrogenase